MAKHSTTNKFDVIIVGSGIAGLLLAIDLDKYGLKTAIICKRRLMESNTAWAQGGVAIASGSNPLDSTEKHLADTVLAGAGLCDQNVARMIVESGTALFSRLEELGLEFDRADGKLENAREGGHSQSRVLHVADASGKAIAQTLISAARQCTRLQIFEDFFAFDLLTHQNRCVGLRAMNNGVSIEFMSPHVVLASGGAGQVYSRTTNPSVATGDGIAMAYRAGARLIDMEFMQFHPTALYLPGAPASLITEAARGAGGQLLDAKGDRFTFRFHPDGELATRDVVARAIQTIMLEQNTPCVYLDLRPIGISNILNKFPTVMNSCRNWGIDPLERPIPVSPAAHYFMGGIWTDSEGRTSLQGLYAIGECASNGLHGANRLASNSLLEGGVMAMRVAKSIAGSAELKRLETVKRFESRSVISESLITAPSHACPEKIEEFRNDMFKVLGLCRNGSKISDFQIENLRQPFEQVPLDERSIESANLNLIGSLIALSALNRCESRGAHFRIDHPLTDNVNYLHRYFVSLDGNGYLALPEPEMAFTLLQPGVQAGAEPIIKSA